VFQEFLGAALAFTGLPLGWLLASIAEEEVKPGEPFFRILRAALAAMIIWFGSASFLSSLIGQFAVTIGIVFILSKRNLFSIAYALWGIFLGLNLENDLTLLAGLIFLYGITEAALRFNTVKRDKMFMPIDFLFFLALGIGLIV